MHAFLQAKILVIVTKKFWPFYKDLFMVTALIFRPFSTWPYKKIKTDFTVVCLLENFLCIELPSFFVMRDGHRLEKKFQSNPT